MENRISGPCQSFLRWCSFFETTNISENSGHSLWIHLHISKSAILDILSSWSSLHCSAKSNVAIHNGVLETRVQFSLHKAILVTYVRLQTLFRDIKLIFNLSGYSWTSSHIGDMSNSLDPTTGDKGMGATSTNSLSSEEHGGPTDEQVLKKARRKVDKRLLIWYASVYLIMRIHVSNITNTAIINLEEGTGIKKQLGNLTSSQWAWALSIFYYPYMFFEPVATLALKRFSPSLWMSRIMITWVWEFRNCMRISGC